MYLNTMHGTMLYGILPPNMLDDNSEEKVDSRPKFGGRFLTNSRNVFEHNAWDNVVWDSEQEVAAQKKVEEQSQEYVDDELQKKYEEEASRYWNDFYGTHQENFFKDRHWLFTEFPELLTGSSPCTTPGEVPSADLKDQRDLECSVEGLSLDQTLYPGQHASFRILEVGCGVGNTVFPILLTNNDPGCFVYGCDFSETAINLVKENPSYDSSRCHAFVCDVTTSKWEVPFPENSLDIVIFIFVLSSISPERMQDVINNVSRYLKPGGLLLLRDYGRFDMAQLRFKKGRCISSNFYVRGDGTRVYFFTQDELRELFEKAGLVEEVNLVDRRLQVNRGKLLKMYRVWIQCKYRKPKTL